MNIGTIIDNEIRLRRLKYGEFAESINITVETLRAIRNNCLNVSFLHYYNALLKLGFNLKIEENEHIETEK